MQEDASKNPDQVAHHPATAMRKPAERQPSSIRQAAADQPPLPNRRYGFLLAALALTCLVMASLVGCQIAQTTTWVNDFAPMREITHLSHWQQQVNHQDTYSAETKPAGNSSSRSLNQSVPQNTDGSAIPHSIELATASTNPKAWWYDRQNQNLISTGAYAAPSMRYEQSWTTTYDRTWATPNGVRDHYHQTRVQRRYEQTGQRR